jgi:hypothetical protein
MTGSTLAGEKRTFTVPTVAAGQALLEERGFGEKEPEVRMMNLMMVEGSGMEGMDMSAMNSAAPPEPEKKTHSSRTIIAISGLESPTVGSHTILFAVKDSKGAGVPHAKISAKVAMTSMDMGTETPRVTEKEPGLYSVRVNFSMPGPWAIDIEANGTRVTFPASVVKKP